MNTLSTGDLIRVSFRMLLVQSAWTPTTMQSDGLVYCMAPALEKIFPDPSQLKRILKHYQTPINTHPFLLGALVGAILRMEEEGQSTKNILSYIRTTMGPMAALGDPFFDGGLAPFASLVAAIIALGFGILPGILALILIYNGIHLAIRVQGIFVGYRMGASTMDTVGNWINADKTHLLRVAGGIVGGFLIGLIVSRYGFPVLPSVLFLLSGLAAVGGAILLTMNRASWIIVLPAYLLSVLLLEVLF